jgi:hypothetical protein
VTHHLTPEHVQAALKVTCEVCKAKAGEPCQHPFTGQPLRWGVHFGRKEIRP